MTWSWISFAIGYLVGGLSCALGAGLLAMGGRDDEPEPAQMKAGKIINFAPPKKSTKPRQD